MADLSKKQIISKEAIGSIELTEQPKNSTILKEYKQQLLAAIEAPIIRSYEGLDAASAGDKEQKSYDDLVKKIEDAKSFAELKGVLDRPGSAKDLKLEAEGQTDSRPTIGKVIAGFANDSDFKQQIRLEKAQGCIQQKINDVTQILDETYKNSQTGGPSTDQGNNQIVKLQSERDKLIKLRGDLNTNQDNAGYCSEKLKTASKEGTLSPSEIGEKKSFIQEVRDFFRPKH